MENVAGLEKILDEFLLELSEKPIYFEGEKHGYVNQHYYHKKFNLKSTDLNELMYYAFKDGYIHKLIAHRDNNTVHDILEITINLKGKEFLKRGGYTKQKDKIKREKNKDFWRGAKLVGAATVLAAALTTISQVLTKDPPPQPLPTTIVLPPIQIVHDTVRVDKKSNIKNDQTIKR